MALERPVLSRLVLQRFRAVALLYLTGACDFSPNAWGPLRVLADSLVRGQSWSCQRGGRACIATLGNTQVYFFANGARQVVEVTRDSRVVSTAIDAEFARVEARLTAQAGVPFDCPATAAFHVARDKRWWLADSTTFVLQLRAPTYQPDPAHPHAFLLEHSVRGRGTCAWTAEPPPI